MKTKIESVHMIYSNEVPTGFFKRDEKSNKNLVYVTSEASLEEVEKLFNSEETCLKTGNCMN